MKKTIYFLFFLSGISGLIYEIVWVRMLSRILGNTTIAITVILAVYMSGLALGSFYFGDKLTRYKKHLKLYGWLELGIGLSALIISLTLPWSWDIYQYIYTITGPSAYWAVAVRNISLFIYILVPTILMGGTLPVLSAFFVRQYRSLGHTVSLLYGLNTLGAVAGVLLSSYVTLGFIGEIRTVIIGVIINIVVGFIALGMSRTVLHPDTQTSTASHPPSKDEQPLSVSSRAGNIVLLIILVSGMTALAYEVIWSRQLLLYLDTSIYAFATTLAIFLFGISAGSIGISYVIKRLKDPVALMGMFQIGIGIFSYANLYLFIFFDNPAVKNIVNEYIASIIILLPITLLFGATFPLAVIMYRHARIAGASSVGRVYAVNTVGNITGSFLASFLFIPIIGSGISIIVLGSINLVLGVCMIYFLTPRPLKQRIMYALMLLLPLGIVILLKQDPFLTVLAQRVRRFAGRFNAPYRIFLNTEGLQGTVTALQTGYTKHLWINGHGITGLVTDTKLMMHLPLMLSHNPENVLVIGFGMGTATKSAVAHRNLAITVVEIVPEVYQCFTFYHPGAEFIFNLPNCDFEIDDGRNFLYRNNKQFDTIVLDPSPPIWSSGTVNLYSREFFDLCKANMSPTGIMCLWIPSNTLEDEVMSILKSYHTVFPHTLVLSGITGGGYYCLGSRSPIPFDHKKISSYLARPEIHHDMIEFNRLCTTAEDVEALFMWDSDTIGSLTEPFPMVTDDFPYTEFPIWRHPLYHRKTWYHEKQRAYRKEKFGGN
ncbi:MAG: hypothetical protein GF384_01210 [Elusimicrobia bacterium]|nr:hypothetical protein [Elusimicrobiota bacterium]MBD3411652.1 hypothetical protein [Elusimicrobiota bacterium]